MHDLFKQVLDGKDLSKAGDLFLLPEKLIAPDLVGVLIKIREIVANEEYLGNENDQSIVEITLARVISCIGELNMINSTCSYLINLLATCLNYDLKHSPGISTKYPPHAKIASDLLSCLFLNYTNRLVMRECLPVAVKFLHKGNHELCRNVTCYLPLAAIENPDLLAKYVQTIADSVIGGNYALARVLPQIYNLNRERIQEHVMALACILPRCEINDKLALLQLFTLVAADNSMLLEPSLPQLLDCLKLYQTTVQSLQVFLALSSSSRLVAEQMTKIQAAISVNINCVPAVAEIFRTIGVAFKDKSPESLSNLLNLLTKELQLTTQATILREILILCLDNQKLVSGNLVQRVRSILGTNATAHIAVLDKLNNVGTGSNIYGNSIGTTMTIPINTSSVGLYNSQLLQSTGHLGLPTNPSAVTVIRLNENINTTSPSSRLVRNHRMDNNRNRMNGGPSLHKSLSKLHGHGSSRPLTLPIQQQHYSKSTSGMSLLLTPGSTSTHQTQPQNSIPDIIHNQHLLYYQSPTTRSFSHLTSLSSAQTLASTSHLSNTNRAMSSKGSLLKGLPPVSYNSTIHSQPDLMRIDVNGSSSNGFGFDESSNGNRISVFEPYPLRDTVQHFCEKHLDKIKAYMEKLSVKIPLPVKCTIEEKKSRKMAKLHFSCQDRSSEHCLYSNNLFTLQTAHPRVWIHIMFLALQSRCSIALSTRESSVSSLKNCWDILKCESRSFLTLVTSAFPSTRDHEYLITELRNAGFLDLFSFNGASTYAQWACFLCNFPDRGLGILNDTNPVIEGEMKEKKGKWRLFKRWRTRYFTLSSGQLSYSNTKKDGNNSRNASSSSMTTLDLGQIRSVRVSRSQRNIPKAFEIFTTEEKTYVLKPKNGRNAEEWVTCLSVLVAHHNSGNISNKKSISNAGVSVYGSKTAV